MLVHIGLERQTDDPEVPSVLSRESDLGETGPVLVVLPGVPEKMVVPLQGAGCACRHDTKAREYLAATESHVDATGVE